MKISKVKGYCLSSQYGDGKVFGQPLGVKSIGIIEVVTDDGFVGIGETYSAVYVPELISPTVKFIESLIVGMNPIEIEKVYDSMNIPFVGMNGLIRTIIGAIEIALWDIKGQVEQKPLYKLLSETNVNDFNVYSSGGSVTYTSDDIKRDIEKIPFDSYKMRVGVQSWEDDKKRVRTAREELGSKDLMVDAIMGTLNTWDRDIAIDNVNSLSNQNLTWFEEPLHPANLKDMKSLKIETNVPIAGGEGLSGKLDFESYLEIDCLDIVQPDITYCGGFIRAKKIIKMAKEKNKKVALHVWGSSISLMSALHLSIACDVDWLEVPTVKLDILSKEFEMIRGIIKSKDYSLQNGLGVNVTNDTKNKYPFVKNSGYKLK